MKRFLVKEEGYPDMRLYYHNLEEAKKNNKNAIIEEIEDVEHLPYIDKIINRSTFIEKCLSNTKDCEIEYYKASDKNIGTLEIWLFKDLDDGHYYDSARTRLNPFNRTITTMLKDITTPREICEKYFYNNISYEIISYRKYGEPKLAKPKILKGLKAISVEFIPNKCTCKYYVLNNDIIILHRDYFSKTFKTEEVGISLNIQLDKFFNHERKKKFTYEDSWGKIILRDEAYICFKDIIPFVDVLNPPQLAQDMCKLVENYHHFDTNLDNCWFRMFEIIVQEIKEERKKTL